MTQTAVLQSDIPGVSPRRGKVRDIYDFGDRLLFIATDRISAFDWVLPSGIPDKGKVLTQISAFWFDLLKEPNDLISTRVEDFGLEDGIDLEPLRGRSSLVRKTDVVMVECVVRGYITGSGWKDYQASGCVSGIELPPGLVESEKLPEPIFTPSTKATEGHDEPISFEQVVEMVGRETAEELRRRSLDIYQRGAEYAAGRGIIIADTKFEFGRVDDEIILIDEVLTPDSSRFWPADLYEPGRGQSSYDKQFVRDWLSTTDWDKNSEPPALPEEIIAKTRAKYIEAYEKLTGETFTA